MAIFHRTCGSSVHSHGGWSSFLSGRVKVEQVLERTAREEMFRSEYQQRAVEDRVQAMKQHRQQNEWIVMDVEDSVAQKIALAEEEEVSRQEKMYEELQKVRNARQQVREI